jgi:beta-galactosidase/beta-glucuronidase
MKKYLSSLITALAMTSSVALAQVGFGHAQKFNNDWKFALTDDSLAIEQKYKDAKWRAVELPHDWSIEGMPSTDFASCTGYLPGGYGTYRKTFEVKKQKDRQYYIYFEGVYCRSRVYLNGHLLGYRPNGYASFCYDMTPWLKSGKNTLCVSVDHTKYADSRWYTGSGIYRDVWMVDAPQTHLGQWATRYYCTDISAERATVHVLTDIENNHPGTTLQYELDGQQVDSVFTVDNPRLWDITEPNLYDLKVRLLDKGVAIDSTSIKLGIRDLRFDANQGFFLNGKNVKVKGVCIHHDAGVLGAAVPPEV